MAMLIQAGKLNCLSHLTLVLKSKIAYGTKKMKNLKNNNVGRTSDFNLIAVWNPEWFAKRLESQF
jgi:hypothetical protein